MWLLGSTSEGDKKGLSDYFNAPLKVALQGGSGAGASNSILSGGGKDLTRSTGQTPSGEGEDPIRRKMAAEIMRAEVAKQDAKKMEALSAKISAVISNSPKLAEFQSQIRLETTPDGLQIQIVDDQSRPMFDTGSALVKPYMRDILREIGTALNGVENKISLMGTLIARPMEMATGVTATGSFPPTVPMHPAGNLLLQACLTKSLRVLPDSPPAICWTSRIHSLRSIVESASSS